jgi:hypothetical protein
MLRASSAPHDQPAVHPHEPGHFLTTSLAGLVVRVLRLRSCRTSGVASFHIMSRVHTGCRRLVALVPCLTAPIHLAGVI